MEPQRSMISTMTFYRANVPRQIFQIFYDVYECKQTKRNEHMISTYHDVRKDKKCKHVENVPYLFEKKYFRF